MRKTTTPRVRSALALTAGALALMSGAAAWAQAADNPTLVEELVVTAEKREMNLQEVPASVSALSGERLETLGLTQLSDYEAYLPGFNVSSLGSPGQAAVTLRGIAPFGPGAVVGSYVDDTPIGSSTAYARATIFALDLLPYDLERFEVLRGPQGTLYGAGAMGGLIKYVLRKADPAAPDVRLGAEVSNTEGSDGLSHEVRGAVNIPLVSGKLAIRASAFDVYDRGYIDNVIFTGPRAGVEEDTNNVHQYGGRLAGTWQATPELVVYLQGMWQRTKSDDNAFVTLGNVVSRPIDGGGLIFSATPTIGDLTQSHAFLQPFSKEVDYYSATVNWNPGPVQFISATSWSSTQTRQTQDATEIYGAFPIVFGLPQGVGRFDLNLELDKFTQEFRLVSPSDRKIEWILGAFYTHEDSANNQLALAFGPDYQPIGGPFAAIFNPFFAFASLPTTYREYAVFGDVTYKFSDRFDITGGLRYAKNDQDFAQISDGLILGGFTSITGQSSEAVTTWMVNARYHFTPDVMLYGRIATGYRPGGPNVSLPGTDIPQQFEADTLISYEAGVRATFWDGRAVANATVFNIDWSNIQLGVLNEARTASFLDNAGDAFSRGVEIEGALTPIEGLRIGFNAAYTKAELTSLIPGAPAFIIGYQLPQVPEWSAGLTADYSWDVRDGWQASVGGGLRYVDDSFTGAVMVPGPGVFDTVSPSYTTLDLRAGLANERWRINLFARNVTDERAYEQGFVRQNLITGAIVGLDAVPIQPRVIGVSLDVDF